MTSGVSGTKETRGAPSPARRTVLAAAAAFAACAPGRSRTAVIRLGYQRTGVMVLARARGVVEAALRPLKTQWIAFPSGPELLKAMNAGAVDFGATGDTPPLFAQAEGAGMQYVAYQPLSGEDQALVVPQGSKIRRLGDLRGRRIGFTEGSSAHLLTAHALARAGLTLDEVSPVRLSPEEGRRALAAGGIDAWAIWDPDLALAQRDLRVRVLISGARLPRADAFFLASDRFLASQPRDLVRLLEALQADALWGRTHHEDLVGLLSAAEGLPRDIVDVAYRRRPPDVEPLNRAALLRQQAAADLLEDLGALPRKIKVADAAWSGWPGPLRGARRDP